MILHRLCPLLLFCMSLTAFAAQASMPRSNVSVRGHEVRLSDVFTDIDESHDTVIFLAPDAGQKITLDSSTLAKLAREHGLNWSPLRETDHSTISRDSQNFGAAEIAALVQSALNLPSLPQGRYEISLSNPLIALHAPTDTTAEIIIQNALYDSNTQHFTATALLQADGETMDQSQIEGRIITKMDLPVLARPVRRGEVIAAQDIAWQEMTVDNALGQALFNAEDIIGKSPRTALRAGIVLRSADLMTPALIKRGSLVTMLVQRGNMQLTAQGRALNDAAMGETVKVVNTTTSRTVEGVAIDAGTVQIGGNTATPPALPMAEAPHDIHSH